MELDGEIVVCVELQEWPGFNKDVEIAERRNARNPSPITRVPNNSAEKWESELQNIGTCFDSNSWQWLGPMQSSALCMIVALESQTIDTAKLNSIYGCKATFVWLPLRELVTTDYAELAAAAGRLRSWLDGNFHSRFIESGETVEITAEDMHGTRPPLILLS